MKLTVLGGAAACPNPGQGSSAYLLEVQGQRWLLDCGPNTLQELRKHVELDQIDRILISHVHADHTLDLIPLRYGLKYDPGIEGTHPGLYMPPGGITWLEGVAKAFSSGVEGPEGFFDTVFDLTEYDPEAYLTFDSVTVSFRRTNHPVPCWAMRFTSPGGTLVYLADTGPMDELVEFAANADILICEGTFPDLANVTDVAERPHLSAFEAGALARDAEVTNLVLTHLWSNAGIERYREAATTAFGKPVMIATPGLQVMSI